MHSVQPVTVSAPSRLHFGLLAVGRQSGLQYGGIGLMVRQPRTVVSVSSAQQLDIDPASPTTVRETVERWLTWQRANLKSALGRDIVAIEQLPVSVRVLQVPPRHQGLGTGTQLAFATALALTRSFQLQVDSAETFSAALNRGRRSTIGTFGFFLGGLLVDRGRLPSDRLSPLDFRTDFPEEWPIVLIQDRQMFSTGLSGAKELAAFDQLSPTAESYRSALVDLIQNSILSGVLQRNFNLFAEGLYQFGKQSGLQFQSVQSGAYHSRQVAELVEFVRACGVLAVGQSSWGPGVFAILPSDEWAAFLINRIDDRYPGRYQFTISQADNQGAVFGPAPSLS